MNAELATWKLGIAAVGNVLATALVLIFRPADAGVYVIVALAWVFIGLGFAMRWKRRQESNRNV